MAHFKLDKNGIKAIEKKMKDRALAIQQQTALEAIQYLLNFGYHAILPSGPEKGGGGYSLYYAANWNYSVSVADTGVINPSRDPFEAEKGEYGGYLISKQLEYQEPKPSSLSDTIYVTNSVYYGKWLNNGGVKFLTCNTESHPNRFIELCEEYLRKKMHNIVINVKNEVK